jgi:hypothetical protein
MTEAQRLRLLELAVQAGASPNMAVDFARQFEGYLAESGVVPAANSTQDSGLAKP